MMLLPVTISFLLSFSLLPVIIRLFKSIDILDTPDRRKIHKYSTPTLGGIGIFVGVLVPLFFTIPLEELTSFKYVIIGMILMFSLGMRDDILSLNAGYKIAFQVAAALVVMIYADIRLSGLYGFFGVGEFSLVFSYVLSAFVFIALTNAFNLIDGIDGLAGSIALVGTAIFGTWFLLTGHTFYATLSFSVSGAVFAFLLYNWHPARLFMGDTGSIFLGFLLSCISMVFINQNFLMEPGADFRMENAIPITFAILILPIYDTLRVFSIRIYSGRSPFDADKKHIHHILLKQGLNHSQSTIILMAFNLLLLALTFALISIRGEIVVAAQLLLAVAFGLYFDKRLHQKLKEERDSNAGQAKSKLFVSKSA